MPLLQSGNARWTPDEEALLVGKELKDAHALSKEGKGPLPYSASQIASKIRTMTTKKGPAKPAEDEDPAYASLTRKQAVDAHKAAKKAAGQVVFDSVGVSVLHDSQSRGNQAAPFAAPSIPSSGYQTPLPRPTMPEYDKATLKTMFAPAVEELEAVYNSDDDSEPAYFRPTPPKKQYRPSPSSVPFTSSPSWSTITRTTVSPVRQETYPHAIVLGPKSRCPWVDLFVHKDWLKIFVCPLPALSDVVLDIVDQSVFVILRNWSFPQYAPISSADAIRSSRPNQFVFKFDIANTGVDLGSEAKKEIGAGWVCFTLPRFD